jgi:general secretion pathway protein G
MAFPTGSGERMMRERGFTLIELMVVMAILATLLTLAVPRYFHSVDRSREAVLRQTLAVTRDAIDKYYGDHGRYPDSLQELVTRRYLRSAPLDPITESETTWNIVPVPGRVAQGEVYDIKSGAAGSATDGKPYAEY